MAGAGKTCLICIGIILIIIGLLARQLLLIIIGVVLFFVGICTSRKASKGLDKTPIAKSTSQTKPVTTPPSTPQKAPEEKAPEQKPETPKYCSLCGAQTTGEFCPDCGTKIE